MNLTVLIPGIRPEKWNKIYDDLITCVGDYTFELICSGPNEPNKDLLSKENFKFIKDFGTPSRCLQMASEYSKGDFICWIPDDCILENGSLKECLDFMYKNANINDGMTLTYSEGINFSGDQDKNENYWIGYTHEDQRLKQVSPEWKIAPLFMYSKSLYFKMGGIDCRFEHVNLNTHDLAYRVQKNGGKIHLSPRKILSVDWIPGQDVITQAHFENDVPLMKSLYDADEFPRLYIKMNNWVDSPEIWQRRFKK